MSSTYPHLSDMCAVWATVTDAQYADLANGRTTLAQIIAENATTKDGPGAGVDVVVDLASGVAIPLESARIVRDFSATLHGGEPDAVVFYAESHGQPIENRDETPDVRECSGCEDDENAPHARDCDRDRRKRAQEIASRTGWKAWPSITPLQTERVFQAMTAAAYNALTEKENAR